MKGFTACHPLTVEVLKSLGIKSGNVTQGWGDAAASAGYHRAVGYADGRKYSTCFDLSYALACPDLIAELCQAGIAAFVRNWDGNQHVHCVHAALSDNKGRALILDGPRAQLLDFMHVPEALDGLKGHQLLRRSVPVNETPNALQQAHLRRIYQEWLPDYPTRVLAPGKQQIACYAWLDDDQVTAEVVKFLTWWGCQVTGGADADGRNPWLKVMYKGQTLDLIAGKPTFDGRRWRAGLRAMGDLLKLSSHFTWDAGHRSCCVQLQYAA